MSIVLKYDEAEIRRAIDLLHPNNEIFEIRITDQRTTASGIFDNVDTALKELSVLKDKIKRDEWGYRFSDLPHIYITLNPVNKDLLSLKQNGTFLTKTDSTTADGDIDILKWLLIDADPKRKKGLSSSEAEKESGKAVIKAVRDYLKDKGWADPIMADSGNGYHLLYRINLPTDKKNLSQKILELLSDRFSTDSADVDRKVFNPGRICKLYGSYAVKGIDTEDRPHRQSKILWIPKEIQEISEAQITAVIEELTPAEEEKKIQQPKQSDYRRSTGSADGLNFEDFASAHGIEILKKESTSEGDGIRYKVECPFNRSHKDASVTQFKSGVLTYHCFHDSCTGKLWEDYREAYESGYKAEKEQKRREYEDRQLMYQRYQQRSDNSLEAPEQTEEELDKERDLLLKEAVGYGMQSFIDDLQDPIKNRYVSTGFNNVDKILDGGLYPGLYFIGAVSSLGKTTFILQMADNLAKAGEDVIYFSLEMSPKDLEAKSISRITYLKDLEENGVKSHAKTSRGILTGSRYKGYSDLEKALIMDSIKEYTEKIGKNLYIVFGIKNITADVIRQRVEKHIKLTGKKPIVIIDYLQILEAPNDKRSYTDKQIVDHNVKDLKLLSINNDLTIIGISSFNRESYNGSVTLTSFKESGAIEYSSDVLIGLQYAGMDEQKGEKDQDRKIRLKELETENGNRSDRGEAIKIELKILKNRYGRKNISIPMDYYPMFNYFTDEDGEDEWIDL